MDTDKTSRLVQEILGDVREEQQEGIIENGSEVAQAEDRKKYRKLLDETLKQAQLFESQQQTPELLQDEFVSFLRKFTFPPYYGLYDEDEEPKDSSSLENERPKSDPYGAYKELSVVSLRLISLYLDKLRIVSLPQYAILDLSVILVTFTDLSDPWTTPESYGIVTKALAESKFTSPEILLDHLLRETIKPLFSVRKHPEITEAGRRAIRSGSLKFPDSYVDPESYPWKYKRPEVITIFHWVLLNLDASLLEQAWPLLVPPVLILLDDVQVPYKTKGCILLSCLLELTPSAFLNRTGLPNLMWESVLPLVHYLPPLTPISQSIAALKSAYATLILLVKKMHPDGTKDYLRNRSNLLNSLIWDGIQQSFVFCAENVHLTEVFMLQIGILSEELGIYTVRHLKYIIPLLSTQLCNPFGSAYPPLLLQSARTVRKVILNAWPRIAGWRNEILKGCIICWGNIVDVEKDSVGKDFEELKKELKNVVKCLRAACSFEEKRDRNGLRDEGASEIGIEGMIEKIMQVDRERCQGLFT